MNYINRILRIPRNLIKRQKLKNDDFSVVANNCIGSFICHDLGLQFKSPFVNLWMKTDDYLKLLCDLEGYLSAELTFTKEANITYPVGLLRDVKIYFQHYTTEEEVCRKWNQRMQRMDFGRLFVLFVEIEGTTYEDLVLFDSLPFANKAMLTHKEYPEFSCAHKLPGYEELGCVGKYYHFKNPFSGVRVYDAFDYVSWFNSGGATR